MMLTNVFKGTFFNFNMQPQYPEMKGFDAALRLIPKHDTLTLTQTFCNHSMKLKDRTKSTLRLCYATSATVCSVTTKGQVRINQSTTKALPLVYSTVCWLFTQVQIPSLITAVCNIYPVKLLKC